MGSTLRVLLAIILGVFIVTVFVWYGWAVLTTLYELRWSLFKLIVTILSCIGAYHTYKFLANKK